MVGANHSSGSLTSEWSTPNTLQEVHLDGNLSLSLSNKEGASTSRFLSAVSMTVADTLPDVAVNHHRPDTRNLQWKSDNVGSKLLQKMGWKEGQAIGKRKRSGGGGDATAVDDDDKDQQQKEEHSSEGLRVKKRAVGLGLGATSVPLNLGSSHHVADFSSLLQHLNHHHSLTNSGSSSAESVSSGTSASADKKKSKKKKKQTKEKKPALVLPTNKSTHSKVRQAKFQSKTEHDMKCIFGTTATFPCSAASGEEATSKLKKKSKKSSNKKKKDRS